MVKVHSSILRNNDLDVEDGLNVKGEHNDQDELNNDENHGHDDCEND